MNQNPTYTILTQPQQSLIRTLTTVVTFFLATLAAIDKEEKVTLLPIHEGLLYKMPSYQRLR